MSLLPPALSPAVAVLSTRALRKPVPLHPQCGCRASEARKDCCWKKKEKEEEEEEEEVGE
jgi:hypothetical protein